MLLIGHIVTERLLALETKINLLLECLGLLTWHELLSMLIGVSQLAAALNIKIFLWTHITVCRRLSERRVVLGDFTALVLVLQALPGCAHASVHQSRSLVWVLFVHHGALLGGLHCRASRSLRFIFHDELEVLVLIFASSLAFWVLWGQHAATSLASELNPRGNRFLSLHLFSLLLADPCLLNLRLDRIESSLLCRILLLALPFRLILRILISLQLGGALLILTACAQRIALGLGTLAQTSSTRAHFETPLLI